MKTLQKIRYAGVAGIAIALSAPALTIAETRSDTDKSVSTVHHISHTLAASQQYTADTGAGYKWGKDSKVSDSGEKNWAQAAKNSGYKWGQTKLAEPRTTSFAEQSANRWKRRSSTEQAANRWKRRSYAEQAANRWKRRSSTEQAANRWKRRSSTEQAANRWKRRSSTEQAANRWKRR